MADETAWHAALQVEAWAGEVRVNLIRAASIVAFYGQHLANYYVLGDPLDAPYHMAITAVTIAWVAVTVAMQTALSARFRPAWLSYTATAADLVLVMLLLMVSDGPKSVLTVLFPLVVMSTALRLDLTLVRAATLCAALLYGGVIVHSYEYRTDWIVPRRQQVVFALAIGCAGLLTGQSVRRARRLAKDYHDRELFLAKQSGVVEGGRA